MYYFLFARKSTDVEDKQVLSNEAQLAELRALAKREGLEIAEVSECDPTGNRTPLPSLRRMCPSR